ncbi:MAG: hypothetical protein V1934_05940 [Methanobacteriota archaeon]
MVDVMAEEKPVLITKGSKYRVVSLESKDSPLVTHGTFLGYTVIGSNEGLCMKLDESHKESAGRLRIIPAHMVSSIDIIKAAEPEKDKGKEPTTMFG